MNLEVLILGEESLQELCRNDENNDDYKGLLYSASLSKSNESYPTNKRSKELEIGLKLLQNINTLNLYTILLIAK